LSILILAWCSCRGNLICDPDGWLSILTRVDDKVSFERSFTKYRKEIGEQESNYWMGLIPLTCYLERSRKVSTSVRLRIKLESWAGEQKTIYYENFQNSLHGENDPLKSVDFAQQNGTIDVLKQHQGKKFVTEDRIAEGTFQKPKGCKSNLTMITGGGGWWMGECHGFYPTAKMGKKGQTGHPYVFWRGAFKGHPHQALKSVTLGIKPGFSPLFFPSLELPDIFILN